MSPKIFFTESEAEQTKGEHNDSEKEFSSDEKVLFL